MVSEILGLFHVFDHTHQPHPCVGYVHRAISLYVSISVSVSYHKKQQYIRFSGGDLNDFRVIKDFMKLTTPTSPTPNMSL